MESYRLLGMALLHAPVSASIFWGTVPNLIGKYRSVCLDSSGMVADICLISSLGSVVCGCSCLILGIGWVNGY